MRHDVGVIPAEHQDISTEHAATPLQEDIESLSKLAAEASDERAEHFAFTDEDSALLDAVLSDADDE
jgi:hypothetical protein